MTTESIKNKFAPGEFVAWVGLDWADKEHKVSMYDVASGQVEASVLRQSGEAFQQWLAGLRKRYGGGKVAVVLEQWREGCCTV